MISLYFPLLQLNFDITPFLTDKFLTDFGTLLMFIAFLISLLKYFQKKSDSIYNKLLTIMEGRLLENNKYRDEHRVQSDKWINDLQNNIVKQQDEIKTLQKQITQQSVELERCYIKLTEEMSSVKNLSIQLSELLKDETAKKRLKNKKLDTE